MGGVQRDDNAIAIEDASSGTLANVTTISGVNRLRTEIDTAITSNISLSLSTKVRHDISTTIITLTSSYQTAYTYSGSGKFIGFAFRLESANTIFKMTVDSDVIFELSLADVSDLLDTTKASTAGGPWTTGDAKKFFYQPIYPIPYSSLVKIEAKETSGKRLFSSFVHLTKET